MKRHLFFLIILSAAALLRCEAATRPTVFGFAIGDSGAGCTEYDFTLQLNDPPPTYSYWVYNGSTLVASGTGQTSWVVPTVYNQTFGSSGYLFFYILDANLNELEFYWYLQPGTNGACYNYSAYWQYFPEDTWGGPYPNQWWEMHY